MAFAYDWAISVTKIEIADVISHSGIQMIRAIQNIVRMVPRVKTAKAACFLKGVTTLLKFAA
jgi:hypothetical protein